MERSRIRTGDVVKYVLCGIVFFSFGFCIGYAFGYGAAIEKGLEMAEKYLNITISQENMQYIIQKIGGR